MWSGGGDLGRWERGAGGQAKHFLELTWKSLGYRILVMAKRITLRQTGMCRQMIKPQGGLDYLEIITAERQEYCSLLGSNGTKLSIKPQTSLTEEERGQLFRSFSA